LTEDFIPLARPDITQEEIDEVVDTLRSGWLAFGPKTQRFEREFAEYIGVEHAVAVSSCTAGMHLALLACGIGQGDEVITSALTFPSTASVIVHTGADVVLADICYDDLDIDPNDIERKITPRTKAIMPVVYAGQPCRMDEIMDIARRRGLKVIEDAATAAGARYRGRPDGSIADASVFSFYAIKNMTTGEGGMVTTNDGALASRIAVLRNQGQDNDAWKRYSASGAPYYTIDAAGFNYRMTDIEASLGLVQLRKLDDLNRRRAELAGLYTRLFADCETVETPTVRPEVDSNWHLYVIRLQRTPVPRNEVVERLSARGIRASVHYYPVHLQPYFRERLGIQKGDLPITEAQFERLISLPLYPGMTASDVERVVEAVRECTRPA
jgi:dTDP-4-amino-4,6-dideoxygalactose transaminase